MALRDGRRRPKMRKFKRGTPVKDRVEPRLQALGYDTSTLQVLRFGYGSIYEILLDEHIIGSYNLLTDQLDLPELPKE